jgi:hypothetical protein
VPGPQATRKFDYLSQKAAKAAANKQQFLIFCAIYAIIYTEREGKCMSIEVNANKIQAMLEYLRITVFEEFTEGDDQGWDDATNFAVTVGSKIMEMLNLNIKVERD